VYKFYFLVIFKKVFFSVYRENMHNGETWRKTEQWAHLSYQWSTMKKILDPFFYTRWVWTKPKTISRYCSYRALKWSHKRHHVCTWFMHGQDKRKPIVQYFLVVYSEMESWIMNFNWFCITTSWQIYVDRLCRPAVLEPGNSHPAQLAQPAHFYTEMEITEIILGKVLRLCQLPSHSHGFLSRLEIF
jgi:hypothetical protein